MHPKLFEVGPVTVSTYGVLVATGVMIGIYLGYRRAKQVGLRTDDYLDTALLMLIASLLGSRLLFVLTNPTPYERAPWKVLYFWDGGLVFYGGVIAGVGTAVYLTWRRRMPFLRTADVFSTFLSWGHAMGRMGCFMAGCCWGKQCPGFGVSFGPDSLVYQQMISRGELARGASGTPLLHAVQLYEAGGELLIFATLLILQRFKRSDGMVFFSYLCLYAILRGTTEMFRGDFARRYLVRVRAPGLAETLGLPPSEPLFLSTSQFVALLTLIGGIAGLVWLYRRARARPASGAKL